MEHHTKERPPFAVRAKALFECPNAHLRPRQAPVGMPVLKCWMVIN